MEELVRKLIKHIIHTKLVLSRLFRKKHLISNLIVWRTMTEPFSKDLWFFSVGKWVVADTTLPQMGTLLLYGTLELDHNNGTRDFVLNCTYLIILGGRLIAGYPDKPYLSNLLISLQGDHSTNPYAGFSGPPIGSKVIGQSNWYIFYAFKKKDFAAFDE